MDATIAEALEKGIRAARRGHKEPAQKLLVSVVKADPQNEEAWLWLSRVIDDPAKRTECLRRVVQINPDNRWAAEQLVELRGGSAGAAPLLGASFAAGTAMEAPQPSAPPPARAAPVWQPPATPEVGLAQLLCPQCGATPTQRGGEGIKTLVCDYCGSVIDLTEGAAAVTGQVDKRYQPAVPIEPGMEGEFEGEMHQVLGWICFLGEDDEGERWVWDEWLLLSSSGKYRWLSYDKDEGFVLQEKILPTRPFDAYRETLLPVPDGAAKVTERSPATIIALAGELTWRAEVDDKIYYVEARLNDKRYSVERTKDELELLEGRLLTGAEMQRAFGIGEIAKLAGHAQDKEQARGIYRIAAYLCIFFVLVSCTGAGLAYVPGQEMAQESFPLRIGMVQSYPLEITSPNAVHEIHIGTQLSVGQWAVVDMTLVDDDDVEYPLAEVEFWDEEGRDSEGYWHESYTTYNHLFVPNEAGPYTLEIEMQEASVTSLPLRMTVKKGVWLSRYFIGFAVLSAIMAFFFDAAGRGLAWSQMMEELEEDD